MILTLPDVFVLHQPIGKIKKIIILLTNPSMWIREWGGKRLIHKILVEIYFFNPFLMVEGYITNIDLQYNDKLYIFFKCVYFSPKNLDQPSPPPSFFP